MKNTRDTYAKKAQKYGNCLVSYFYLSNISTMWVASEIVVLTFQRLRGINGEWKRVEEVCVCVWDKAEIQSGWILMWKHSWGGNLKGEVWQGQGREQGNKNRMVLGPTWNILDQKGRWQRKSLTVWQYGNCVLPLCYLLFLLCKRLALNLQKKCVCVMVLWYWKYFMIHLSFPAL